MRCPKCNSDGCKYDESWKERASKITKEQRKREGCNWRINFKASCKKCGWKGEC